MAERRPLLDYERHGQHARDRISPDRGVAGWTPANDRHDADLSEAWEAFLASERERRGNPSWQFA